MKAKTYFLLCLMILQCNCTRTTHEETPVTISNKPITTDTEAIDSLKGYLIARGQSIDHDEISAKFIDGMWSVLRWIAFYPENIGSSKFVPGGHELYLVTTNGVLTQIIPGK